MFFDQGRFPKKPFARLLLLSSSIAGIAGAAGPASADQFTDAYDASTYSFCDAVMVGVLYGVNGVEGKSKIGANILQGGGIPEVERLLAQARSTGIMCNFEDTGYQFADAQIVAGVWGVPVDQAKTKIAQIVSAGDRAALNGVLAANAPR
jgi:hypothetical protein